MKMTSSYFAISPTSPDERIIPPMDLQEKFENMMAPVSQKIVNIEIENQQLTQLRDWLLPMLMNGQVSIK